MRFYTWQYGIMVGLLYWKVNNVIDETVRDGFVALAWISALALFVFLFKAIFNATLFPTLLHEKSNGAYGHVANALADLTVFLTVAVLYWIPLSAAYFMIGFETESFLFFLLIIYAAVFTGDAVPNVAVQFTRENAALVSSARDTISKQKIWVSKTVLS